MATILTDDGPFDVVSIAQLTADQLNAVTGFELKPEGLCQADVCIPTRSRPDLRTDAGIDLRVAAELLERPLAVDDETGDAVLGAAAATRAASVVGQDVRDLVLHDLEGNAFAWRTIGRKKKVFVAWASW